MIRAVARTYREAFAGLPRDVWLLCLVMLVNRSGTMVLPFLSLYLTQDRGAPVTTAGAILSLWGLGSVIGVWTGGWASDRFGTERTLAVCLAGSGALFLGVGLLRDLRLIAAGLLVLSIVSESFRPACMAAMAHRAPASLRVRSFALMRLAVNLGMGVGPAVAGWLALVDYRLLFVADGLTSWAAAGVLAFVPVSRAAQDEAEAPGGRAGSPWADPPFLLLMLAVTLLATVFFQILGTMPLYFREVYGFGEGAIGLLLALNAALIVAFEMVLIHRAERHDRLLLIGAGALCIGGGFALMPLGKTAAWIALTIGVWTLGEMLALPLLNVVAADRAGAGHRGRYMGMYALSFSIAFICAPAVGTWTYEHIGPHAVWYGAGLATVPLAFAFALLRRALK